MNCEKQKFFFHILYCHGHSRPKVDPKANPRTPLINCGENNYFCFTFFIFRATLEPKVNPKAYLRMTMNYEKKMNFFLLLQIHNRSKIRSKNTPIHCEQKKFFVFFTFLIFRATGPKKKLNLCPQCLYLSAIIQVKNDCRINTDLEDKIFYKKKIIVENFD